MFMNTAQHMPSCVAHQTNATQYNTEWKRRDEKKNQIEKTFWIKLDKHISTSILAIFAAFQTKCYFPMLYSPSLFCPFHFSYIYSMCSPFKSYGFDFLENVHSCSYFCNIDFFVHSTEFGQRELRMERLLHLIFLSCEKYVQEQKELWFFFSIYFYWCWPSEYMAILELHAKLSFPEHYISKIVDFIIILMFGIVKTLCNFQLDFECTFKLKCCSACAMNEVKSMHSFVSSLYFSYAMCISCMLNAHTLWMAVFFCYRNMSETKQKIVFNKVNRFNLMNLK